MNPHRASAGAVVPVLLQKSRFSPAGSCQLDSSRLQRELCSSEGVCDQALVCFLFARLWCSRCLSDCHRACYYPFPTSFFSLTVSSLMVKWSSSLPRFFFFFWATVFTLVKSLSHPRSKGRTFSNSSLFQRTWQCSCGSPDHHFLIQAVVQRKTSAQSCGISWDGA